MYSTIEAYEQNEYNKENCKCQLEKQIAVDDDDYDAESSHSDCLIIESDDPVPISNSRNASLPILNILPNTLSKHTKLILAYENRLMDVSVSSTIYNLAKQQRITISHLNYFYSIPKRHLFLSNTCDVNRIFIPEQCRIMYTSSTKATKYSLGFICEFPSIENHLRHLVLFDDGTAIYAANEDFIYICLCQDFHQNLRFVQSAIIRENIQDLFSNKTSNKKPYQLHNYVRVKKFDDKYHNAQIIEIDCSIIKLKFYERRAQTEIWMHRQSKLIDHMTLPAIDLASPVILENKQSEDSLTKTLHLPTINSFNSDSYQPHRCSPYCVLMVEENFYSNSIVQNPYTIPLSYGWKYYHINRNGKGRYTKKPSTHKRTCSRSKYLYRSPCGRSLLTLDEIEQYLFETNSKLSMKYFVEERSARLEPSIEYNYKYILNEDISQGKENSKISVYNDCDSNHPDPFNYGIETRSQLTFINDTTKMTCCSCTDNCRNRFKCPCWLKTFQQAKLNDNEQIRNWQKQNLSDEQMIERFGYIYQRLKVPVWSGIYECNSKCLCHRKQCTNRVVQNGLYQQLQLFYTTTKGWGIRVLHDMPHGSFINAYVGELITEEIAGKRDFKYLAILDHKSHLYKKDRRKGKHVVKNHFNQVKIIDESIRIPKKRCVRLSTDSQIENVADNDEEDDDDDNDDSCFILDAKYYGSISRFYNHSCKPNVHIQNVFINSHDPRFPVIALFACRNIRAGEELCWDYNYTVGCMPNVRIDCQCQASNCRGRLL